MVITVSGFHKVKHHLLIAAIVACLAAGLSSTSMAAESLQKYSEELAAIAKQVNSAVVSIFIEGRDTDASSRGRTGDPFSPQDLFWEWQQRGEQPRPEESLKELRRQQGDQPFELLKKGKKGWSVILSPGRKEKTGAGTGIIVGKEGHIVTTSHLVEDSPGKIKVKLNDGREFEAELVGADPPSGVAVIKIDADDLTAARPGNSDDVKVGELMLAFGNLRDPGITVTMGIVSATGRTGLGITTYEDFIQTDAMVSPGSGGGPLVNARGEVIGMIIASHEEGSATFAVPMNTVLDVMDDLVSEGEVTRGWLGVEIQEVSPELAEKLGLEEPRGAIVARVGGPAREGGIEAGDVITEFDGKMIRNVAHLKSTVAHAEPGTEVAVTVMRRGKEKKLTVKTGKRTEKSMAALGEREASPEESGWTGIVVQELTRELAKKFGYEGEKGVLISHVRRDSPAHKAGLQSGDLIQEVDHESISTMEDYEKAMEAAGDSILLRIKRGDRVWFDVIKAKDE